MNAAGQRRLTPLLGGAAVVLLATLGAFALGVGRGVQWDPPGEVQALPAPRPVAMPEPVPLARFAEVWQRPLFMADRKPVAASGDDDNASNLGDLELTGIIMSPGARIALLRDRGKDTEVRVKEGTALADGHWTLASLTPRSAIFDSGGEHRELTLKVAAPDALTKDGRQPAQPGQPGQPQPPAPAQALPPGAMRVGQPGSGMTGPALPHPSSAASRQQPARQDDDALQRARIDALKQAVQKRRMEQQQQRQQAQDTQ